MTDLHNKRVVVMGLGRFGGGAAVTRFAAERGAASVVVSDRADADNLASGLAMIDDLTESGTVTLSLGAHDPAVLGNADILVVNPAVPTPWNNPFVRAALDKGLAVETEIALAIDEAEHAIDRTRGGAVIAITGSVGKSTTAAMTHHALRALGRPAALGGNIGGSLLPTAATLAPDTIAVLELSSAMLHWLRETRPAWSPDVAVLSAFEPNHLDWHADLDHYRAAKQHLLDALSHATRRDPTPAAVLARSVADWPVPPGARVLAPDIPDNLETAQPGAHNRANATLAGAAAAAATGLDPRDAARAAAAFPGLPHRLAYAGTRRGVAAYNDSKSTTPGTTAAAVAAVRERHTNVWLIAGGADKGVDLSSLVALDTAGILTIGTTGPAIAAAARDAGRHAIESRTLETAVRAACERAEPNDAILLSPACASWDQFPNYEARGDAFCALLDTHLGATDG